MYMAWCTVLRMGEAMSAKLGQRHCIVTQAPIASFQPWVCRWNPVWSGIYEVSRLLHGSPRRLAAGTSSRCLMSYPYPLCHLPVLPIHVRLQVILGCSAKVFPDEWREKAGPVLDFFSSSVATLVCSVVSTPQMVLTDRESSPAIYLPLSHSRAFLVYESVGVYSSFCRRHPSRKHLRASFSKGRFMSLACNFPSASCFAFPPRTHTLSRI